MYNLENRKSILATRTLPQLLHECFRMRGVKKHLLYLEYKDFFVSAQIQRWPHSLFIKMYISSHTMTSTNWLDSVHNTALSNGDEMNTFKDSQTVIKWGLASYCKADTTFTFHFSISTLSNAFLSINDIGMKSESDFSSAMASQPLRKFTRRCKSTQLGVKIHLKV